MGFSSDAELARLWIEFELPPAPTFGGIVLDGDVLIGRALRSGIGVTAHDVDDALALIAAWLVEWDVIATAAELPPVATVTQNIDIDGLGMDQLGNPAWRGIWSPPDNLAGPTPLGSTRR